MNATKNINAIEPLLLTKREAARMTSLGTRAIDQLAAMKVLRRIRPAGMRCSRFLAAEVRAWVAAGCPKNADWRRGLDL